MSFRQRLALFLIVTLIGVQGLTAISAYQIVRGNLVDQGKHELAATASVFMRQLTVLSERVADDVEVLSLDYALRKAVAEHDQATALSALKNHGNRIGATRMMLVGLDGRIDADTAHSDDAGKAFPFTDLLDKAGTGDNGTSLAVLDGAIYWIVVVPVRAPVPIAFIAASVPVDDALLEKMRQLSSVPQSLALATRGANGAWTLASRTKGYSQTVELSSQAPIKATDSIVTEQHGDHLAMVARLTTAEKSLPVVAILDYPLDQALSAYGAVITPMLLVLGASFLAALIGAMLIARGVSLPLEMLASTTRRIAQGDYRPLPAMQRRDEIGQLSAALSAMTSSIAERETALKGAVASLELARNEAVRASQAKSQFLSNMSHELRTPLNAIIGFSEMIYRQLVGPIAVARYLDYAKHIHDSGAHLLVQVQEMLDLSDAADGKLAIARKPVKPGALVESSLEALAPVAAEAKVTLEAVGDPASWPAVAGDTAKLQQSLNNIVHNAIKFTPPGGSVRIGGAHDGKSLKIAISDTGIGIGADDLDLVTRPFHRRKQAFDARHQGAGLGLPFAKTIVELHGGALRLESAPGQGTTVTIELPLMADDALNNAA